MPHEERVTDEPTPTEQPGVDPAQEQGQGQQAQQGQRNTPPAPPSAIPPPTDTGQAREPNPIGVPNMVYDSEAGEYVPFTATVQTYDPRRPVQEDGSQIGGLRGSRGSRAQVEDVRPTYYAGDEDRLFATRSRHDIIRIQRGLAEAGVLDPDDLNAELGVWGNSTSAAMKDVLGFANKTGVQNWEEALNRRIQASREGGKPEDAEMIVEPYQPPSYDELAEAAQQTARDIVGRDLKPWEVKLLADKLGSLHREAFDTNIVVEKAKADAARELAEEGARGGEGVQTATPTVNGIQDPSLAFRAFARQHFKEEVERQEDVEESAQNFRLATRVLRSAGEI